MSDGCSTNDPYGANTVPSQRELEDDVDLEEDDMELIDDVDLEDDVELAEDDVELINQLPL